LRSRAKLRFGRAGDPRIGVKLVEDDVEHRVGPVVIAEPLDWPRIVTINATKAF
jgi:hypothetical protein